MNLPLRFGGWTFDPGTRELRRPPQVVHLSPKAFDLLAALLEARPRVLSKQELKDRLWPKTFVSDSGLARLVREIRRALGDSAARPAFLRTVHRVGYAFCGTATVEAPSGAPDATLAGATCRLHCGPHELVLPLGETVLGRGLTTLPWADTATVSRRHARILVSTEGVVLEDLGSKNGTFLAGERAKAPTPLKDGDLVRLGSVQLTVRLLSLAVATKTYTGLEPDER